MRTALEAVRLGQATPRTSMYRYHAVHDQYPAIADVDKLAEKYRREGVDVTYRRFRFGEHMIVALTGVPSSPRFLSERFGLPGQATLEARTAPPSRTLNPSLNVSAGRLALEQPLHRQADAKTEHARGAGPPP